MALPDEIVEHIKDIATPFVACFVPHRSGTTNNPFFTNNAVRNVTPSIDRRNVECPMPPSLRNVYSMYDADVEFVLEAGGRLMERRAWTFLSETEMELRHRDFVQAGQARCVDLAISYRGMGHVKVLVYDPVSDDVFEDFDGGANGFDRAANRNRRLETNVASISKVSFETWWAIVHEHQTN